MMYLCIQYYVPTKIHFGKGMISHLSELAESGKSVLMVYGGGSVIDTAKSIAAGTCYDGDVTGSDQASDVDLRSDLHLFCSQGTDNSRYGGYDQLSAYYDITHGVGLAILTPRWMKHILSPETAWKFGEYGREVWGISGEDDLAVGKETIRKTAEFFFDVLGLPKTLTEVGIGEEKLELMASNCAPRLANAFVPLTKEDVLAIFTHSDLED